MASSLVEQVDMSSPTILMGDLNSISAESLPSRFWSAKIICHLVKRVPVDRIRSLATRLSEMVDGGTLSYLEKAGFVESDPTHQPTILLAKAVGIAQLDHLLHTDDIAVNNFQVHRFKGSDHKAISADIATVI
jgi:endonuclease/exonuclease/phosphatase family metal-dependent hydrolase